MIDKVNAALSTFEDAKTNLINITIDYLNSLLVSEWISESFNRFYTVIEIENSKWRVEYIRGAHISSSKSPHFNIMRLSGDVYYEGAIHPNNFIRTFKRMTKLSNFI